MRQGPPDAALSSSAGWRPLVASWHGSTLLAERVPVLDGTMAASARSQIPEQLSLRVPALDGGRSWLPGVDPMHPLARFGQRLAVSIEVTARRRSWVTRLGWFQVQDWAESADGSAVDVTCVGLLQRVADDGLPTASSPSPGSTFESEFRRLMSGGIPVMIDPQVDDRAVPLSFSWDTDRLGALYSLADAWPARLSVDGDGVVRVLPPLAGTPIPVLSWTDGQGGVATSAAQADTRDAIFTSVIAVSSATDDANRAPVYAEARAGGIFGEVYGAVRRRYSSPLITNAAEASAAAQMILADSLRPARRLLVSLPPDPRVELGDPVSVTWDGVEHRGWVVDYRLPLVVGGEMSVTVGLA